MMTDPANDPVAAYAETRETTSERTQPQVQVYVGTSGELTPPKHWPKTKYSKVREMRRHPTIALARQMIAAPVLAAKWSFEQNDHATPDMVDYVQQSIDPVRDEMLYASVMGLIDFGWQAFEKVVRVNDQARVELCKVKSLLHDLTELIVDERTGELLGVQQDLRPFANHAYHYSDERFSLVEVMVLSMDVEGTNWYGESMMSAAEMAYDKWMQAEKGAAQYDKKMSGAHWVIKYPQGVSLVNGVDLDNYEVATNILAKLEASGQIIVPVNVQRQVDDMNAGDEAPQWSIELISAQGGVTAFMERLKYFDALLCRAFGMSERAIIEGQFGTKAEAQAHADMSIVVMERRHLQITNQVNLQLVNPLLEERYGPEAKGAVYVEPAPIADLEREFIKNLYAKMIEQPEGLASELLHIDMEALRDRIGIPWKEEKDYGVYWGEWVDESMNPVDPTDDGSIIDPSLLDSAPDTTISDTAQLVGIPVTTPVDLSLEYDPLKDGEHWVTVAGQPVLVDKDGVPQSPVPDWSKASNRARKSGYQGDDDDEARELLKKSGGSKAPFTVRGVSGKDYDYSKLSDSDRETVREAVKAGMAVSQAKASNTLAEARQFMREKERAESSKKSAEAAKALFRKELMDAAGLTSANASAQELFDALKSKDVIEYKSPDNDTRFTSRLVNGIRSLAVAAGEVAKTFVGENVAAPVMRWIKETGAKINEEDPGLAQLLDMRKLLDVDSWVARGKNAVGAGFHLAYDPSQPRDDHGRWAPDTGGSYGGGGAATKASWNKPTPEQLDRAHKIGAELQDGDVANYIDRQMRGGTLKRGEFTPFSAKTKTSNLKKIKNELEALRVTDPEAFDAFRGWELAEAFGVDSYDDIPQTITVYRGHDADEETPRLTNVTHKREIADEFGKNGVVSVYEIDKDDIGFTLSGSVFDEGELLIFDTKKLKLSASHESDVMKESKRVDKVIEKYSNGTKIKTKDGVGKVLSRGIVGGSLIVEYENGMTDYAVSLKDIDE